MNLEIIFHAVSVTLALLTSIVSALSVYYQTRERIVKAELRMETIKEENRNNEEKLERIESRMRKIEILLENKQNRQQN